MNNLAIVIEQIKDEIEVDITGKGKATARAVSRLIDVEHSSVLRALNPGALKPSKIAEILIEQGFDGGALEGWKTEGIPDIAIASIAHYYGYEAGRYCTNQAKLVCKAFSAIGIRVWIQGIKGWNSEQAPSPSPQPLLPPPTPQEISTVIDLIFQNTVVDPNLVAGVKANAIVKKHPQYKEVIEEALKPLAIPVEENLYTATDLATLYNERAGKEEVKSGMAMNKILEAAGLQKKNPDGKPNWLATEQGSKFSQLMLETARGRDKTVQSLKWFPSVIDYLVESENA
jgi:hypothetical protein